MELIHIQIPSPPTLPVPPEPGAAYLAYPQQPSVNLASPCPAPLHMGPK